ncbi:hypothetical protein B0H21DRAFT_889979 [Amylocystis lapponica]|nr:hypothetical protein B0H21DRAFT_889979 [Amylocystis lapponica]
MSQTPHSAFKRRRLNTQTAATVDTSDEVPPKEYPQNPFSQLSAVDKVDLAPLSRKQRHAWAISRTVQLQEYLSELQVLQTRTAPINQLPNELVVEILSHLREDKDDMAWIRATSICRHWRSVALSTPKLWSNIHVTFTRGLSFLRACLNRARDIDVAISIDKDVGINVEWLRLLSSHKTNIVSMELPIHPVYILPAEIDAALKFPMPKLEFLALTTRFSDHVLLEPAAGQFPCLRSLTLDNVSLRWTPSVFSSIVSLCLANHNNFKSSPLKTFLGAVEACPHLQSLELVEFHPDRKAVPGRLPPIVLPQLRKLLVANHIAEDISFFFDLLDLPSGCNVSLECSNLNRSRSSIVSSIDNILPEATNRLRCFSEASYLVLSVTNQDYIEVEAGLGESPLGTGSKALFDLRMQFDGSVESPSSFFVDALDRFSRAFASSPLTALEIIGEHNHVHEQDWRAAFVRFPLLEQLTLNSFKSPCTLGSALCALHPSESGALVCPQLRELIIKTDIIYPKHRDVVVDYLEYRAQQEPRLAFLQLESAVDEEQAAHRAEFPDDFIAVATALVDKLRIV